MLTAGFILYPHHLVSSVALPAEMLSAADNLYRARQRRGGRLHIRIARLDDHRDHGNGDRLQLQPNCSYQQLADVDLLYLPAMWRNPLPVLARQQAIFPLLQHLAAAGRLICAVGTGSCFLAEAGLLDGKPATSHWFFMEQFAARYPAVQTKNRHLITRAGNLYCAGSINSVADITGHFIEHFYDQDIARQVNAHFSPEIRRSYRERGYFEGEANTHHDEAIIDAQHWLQQHATESVDFHRLALKLDMSQRSFNRRFARVTGLTPGRYLQQLRLQQACELLRDSNLPIAEIANRVGYPDLGHFSTLFRKHMSQTPSGYRKSVRGKLFKLP
jgi:transcriptional regulator GlxA family with amidase domain